MAGKSQQSPVEKASSFFPSLKSLNKGRDRRKLRDFLEKQKSIEDLLRPDVLSWADSFTSYSRRKHILSKIEEMWGPAAKKKLLSYLQGMRWRRGKIKAGTYPVPANSIIIPIEEKFPGLSKAVVTDSSVLSLELACLHRCGVSIKSISRKFGITQREVKSRVAGAMKQAVNLGDTAKVVFWSNVFELSSRRAFDILSDPSQYEKLSPAVILRYLERSQSILTEMEEARAKKAGIPVIEAEVSVEDAEEYDERHKAYLDLLKNQKKGEK